MPISNWDAIPAIMNEVYALQPKSVLDLGVGFGKFGPLLREVLDAMHGRCGRSTWRHLIVGVEGFEKYENPCWQVYDRVSVGDFSTQHFDDFDLVLMIDSLEHLEPERGKHFLRELLKHNKHVIVSVPVVPMPQGAMYGNEFETHRTHHDGSEFSEFNPKILYRGMTQAMSMKGKA